MKALHNFFRSIGRKLKTDDERAASVFERDGRLIFHPLNKTASGVRTFGEPVLVGCRSRPEEMISHLQVVLEASKTGIAYDVSLPMSRLKPLFKAAGVRSYKQFADGAALVEVSKVGPIVTFVPTTNRGKNEGWGHRQEDKISTNVLTGNLATALLEALERAVV